MRAAIASPDAAAYPIALFRFARQTLLSVYGLDELSDTEGEGTSPEHAMSPTQIALMRARRTNAERVHLMRAQLGRFPRAVRLICSRSTDRFDARARRRRVASTACDDELR